jgi:hypothetical protein
VNFVNLQHKLSRKEKYFYVKTLRAQMSTYEQVLLFINSLSFLGMVWDLMPSYQKWPIKALSLRSRKNNQLISKYNLIKNLPGEHIYGIRYKTYYSKVKYEFDHKFK